MRRVAPLMVAVALAAIGASRAHADPGLTYFCSPPLPRSEANCAGWHDYPVTIRWKWDTSVATAKPGECGDQTFTQDSDGLTPLASCTVVDDITHSPYSRGATLKIDRTPPTVRSAAPDRPSDFGVWWNGPVTFAFSGSDALSGLASCDRVRYAGPDGAAARVTGGCHDVAGNYGVRAFALSFDSTPPALRGVKARPRSRSAVISWKANDAVSARLARNTGKRRPVTVYSGRDTGRFTDSGLANGTTYTYTLTVFDAAGNASSRRVHAKPKVSLGLKPARGKRVRRPPLLRWPAVKNASYYNLQLWRGRRKLLTAWPARARLRLHRHGRFAGARFTLIPGHYRWYVWPGFGSRAAHHYGAFIGQSSFSIVR